MSNLKTVPLGLVRENPVALRTVNKSNEKYLGIVQSMKIQGFLGAITARARKDPDTGTEYFEIVDGLQRFSAAKDAGLATINLDIVDLSEDQVIEAQIMANFHRIDTRPCEYTVAMRQILTRNPMMTEVELAGKLGVSLQFIQNRFSLTKINDKEIIQLIDSGEIKLYNAYALAKLPEAEQKEYVQRAIAEPVEKFVASVNERVKEIRDAKRKGLDAKPQEFAPVAFCQNLKVIKEVLDGKSPVMGTVLNSTGAKDPQAGFLSAIAWVLHLDPMNIEIQKSEYEARQAVAKEKSAKREAERVEKLKKKADEATAALKATEKK